MYKDFSVIAVVPARGGSKGVFGKNIKPLLGKPLIFWTIKEAKKSKYIDRLVVSTDNEEIAKVARDCGADVPFLRPAELSQDLSHTKEAVLHVLDWLRENEGYSADIVVLLPPTAPLRGAADIDKGIQILGDSPDADSVRPVVESPKHPYKTLKIEGEYLKPFFSKEITGFDEPYDLPRQRLPKSYIYSGAMQVLRERTLRKYDSLTGNKSKYFLMKDEDSVNIDTLMDFKFAELLMEKKKSRPDN